MTKKQVLENSGFENRENWGNFGSSGREAVPLRSSPAVPLRSRRGPALRSRPPRYQELAEIAPKNRRTRYGYLVFAAENGSKRKGKHDPSTAR
jgi:hypothetical protein